MHFQIDGFKIMKKKDMQKSVIHVSFRLIQESINLSKKSISIQFGALKTVYHVRKFWILNLIITPLSPVKL